MKEKCFSDVYQFYLSKTKLCIILLLLPFHASLANTLYGSLQENQDITLHFLLSDEINAAWVGYRSSNDEPTFHHIDYQLQGRTLDGQYHYRWDSNIPYNESAKQQFYIQANTEQNIVFAPGETNVTYYDFHYVSIPEFTDVEVNDEGTLLTWTPISEATHYKLQFPTFSISVPESSYLFLHHRYAPIEVRIKAVDRHGAESLLSQALTIPYFEPTGDPKPPKTQVLYFGNSIMNIARTASLYGYIQSSPVYPSGYAWDSRGYLFTGFPLDDSSEQVFKTTLYINDKYGGGRLEGPGVLAIPKHGSNANPRPNPEIIPRPNGRLLLVVESEQDDEQWEVHVTRNDEIVAFDDAWEKVAWKNQFVYRLNADIQALEGDDICINLRAINSQQALLDNHCQPFIQYVGSLFGEVESYSTPSNMLWSEDVTLSGWFVRDIDGIGNQAGYPGVHILHHRVGGALPNPGQSTLDRLYKRPDIVKKYGEEFASSVYGFEYTYHISNAPSLGLRVYDVLGNGRVLYNGIAVPDEN